MRGCDKHFHKKISSEEVGEAVSIVYGKYLLEHKKIPMESADTKIRKVMELLELISKAEENAQEHDEYAKKICYSPPYRIDDDIDKMKFYLCEAFRDYCMGEHKISEGYEEVRFVVFKLATSFVFADVVSHALKRYSVIFR